MSSKNISPLLSYDKNNRLEGVTTTEKTMYALTLPGVTHLAYHLITTHSFSLSLPPAQTILVAAGWLLSTAWARGAGGWHHHFLERRLYGTRVGSAW